jgi:hypothetical protein
MNYKPEMKGKISGEKKNWLKTHKILFHKKIWFDKVATLASTKEFMENIFKIKINK